ncbi:MAG: tripartite tricarboxylate transporter substrate-binding protein [Pseudorhodoplanes sp.]
MKSGLSVLLLSLLVAFTAIGDARAQSDYPDRPLTMIVTFAAGGSSDVLARAVANAMSQGLGKQIIIENRPGAGGNIGAEAAAKATPDGYTLLFGTNGTLGIGPALYKNLRYDPQRDLIPVGMLHQLPLVLIVNPQVPAQNLGELIAYAKKNPGKLTFASAGVGSASHLTAELFKIAGERVLQFLIDHCNKPEWTCRFRWRAHSIAFWDNRCTHHKAIWDYWPNVRSGFRIQVEGTERPVAA